MMYDQVKETLLDAILAHVPFDGWSQGAFDAAVEDTDVERLVADTVCPRGALDLAVSYHRRGDEAMAVRMRTEDLSELRYSEKVATAVRFRLEAAEDKEVVRRGTTLFALPHHAAEGSKLIWGTADAIWDALGDSSDDINWYTKRATLSAVYGSTVLFWLGDDSAEHQATWAFLERRIADVMSIEKLKGQLRDNPFAQKILAGPNWLASMVRAPAKMPRGDLPGSWISGRSDG